MNNTNVIYGDSIDISIKLENIKFEDLNIPTTLDIYKNNELFLSFTNGKGFSIIKINETEEVFVDIAISDTDFFFDLGEYEWKMIIKKLDNSVYKELGGLIKIIDGNPIKKEKNVKPWDLLNYKSSRVSKEKRKERLEICKSCPELSMGICKQCGCVMALKTTLQEAKCPLNKW